MLVLSRRQDEAIVIGTARIVIVRISGNRVQLGVEAPKSVTVIREELLNARVHESAEGVEGDGGGPSMHQLPDSGDCVEQL